MKILKEYIDGFRWIDGNTSSVSFEKDSALYNEKLAEGFELVLMPQSEKDEYEQEQKLTQAETDFNTIMLPVLQTANQLERDTWVVQEKEARDWLVDNTARVPFITTLAATRGVELSELVARIIAKADAYAVMLATALGEKHKAEDNA